MALCRFIYGVIKEYLCYERVLHVHYISIDDLVITTPLKKRYSCPVVDLVHLVLGQNVASLLSICIWLNDCVNGDEADFMLVQTQKTQSLYYANR